MKNGRYHVIEDAKGVWIVVKGGSARASKRFSNKDDAIAWSIQISQNRGTDSVLHRKDGSVLKYLFRKKATA